MPACAALPTLPFLPTSAEGDEDHHEVTTSDFKRGKRLKRLLKLLSGKQVRWLNEPGLDIGMVPMGVTLSL